MKYHVNKNIRSTVRVFPEQGRYAKHRYDMNENPKGLPKNFRCICQEKVDTNKNETQNPDSVLN